MAHVNEKQSCYIFFIVMRKSKKFVKSLFDKLFLFNFFK